MVDIDGVARALLLRLRQLLDEIDALDSMMPLEVMWQIRTHTANQAEIPQAIFRVGDRLASVIYLKKGGIVGHKANWEVQLGGDAVEGFTNHQFDTFEESVGFIERCRKSIDCAGTDSG